MMTNPNNQVDGTGCPPPFVMKRFPFAKFYYTKMGTWVCRNYVRMRPPLDSMVFYKDSRQPIGKISKIFSTHFVAVTPESHVKKEIPKRGCILYLQKKKLLSDYIKSPFRNIKPSRPPWH